MIASRYEVVLRLDRLAFSRGAVAPTPGRSIRFLPFHLAIDTTLGLLVQEPLEEVQCAVEEAYRAGSMLSVPLGEGTFGKQRAADALDGLLAAYGATVAGRKFLEVGCGTGALLARLRDLGALVRGCEMGPQAREAERRHSVPVIQEPFSARIGGGPYDCIYSYGVFEHIADVPAFLADCRALLAPGGLFFAIVPDCGPLLRSGDAAMLAHEHYNYFTARSASRLLAAHGFAGADASAAPQSGDLRISGRAARSGDTPPQPPSGSPAEATLARRYAAGFRARREAVAALLQEAEADGRRPGFYAGGHQYADLMESSVMPRFFDGDAFLHEKAWLEGLPPIESPWALRTNPCDVVVIFPQTYVEVIRRFLVAEVKVPAPTRIVSCAELVDARGNAAPRAGRTRMRNPLAEAGRAGRTFARRKG